MYRRHLAGQSMKPVEARSSAVQFCVLYKTKMPTSEGFAVKARGYGSPGLSQTPFDIDPKFRLTPGFDLASFILAFKPSGQLRHLVQGERNIQTSARSASAILKNSKNFSNIDRIEPDSIDHPERRLNRQKVDTEQWADHAPIEGFGQRTPFLPIKIRFAREAI